MSRRALRNTETLKRATMTVKDALYDTNETIAAERCSEHETPSAEVDRLVKNLPGLDKFRKLKRIQ